MSDLVQRLRAEIDEDVNEPMDRLLEDAAAEIERLFEENGKLANTMGAENLQLRAEAERLQHDLNLYVREVALLQARNVTLRAAVREVLHSLDALGLDGWSEAPHLHSLNDLCAAAVSMGDELTTKIRAGEADDGDWRREVLAVVRQSVEDKLRIANPRYLENDLAIRDSTKEN